MTIQSDKSPLRIHFRQLRRQISVEERFAAAKTAAQHFKQHPLFNQSERIACYMPVKDEFETKPLRQLIWQTNKQCYLPILTPEKSLEFARYDEEDELVLNRYNILEPRPTSERIPSTQLDLVIVPLVAFDTSGHRLGTGGGYYDRTFDFLLNQPHQKPFLLGLGYATQQATSLPSEAWDINLHGILTEQKIIIFQ